MRLVRYADRPDLREIRGEELTRRAFPEYMNHNEAGGRFWARLYVDHPDFQLALLDDNELVAELHSVPVAWDGTGDDLPAGWDDAFTRGFEGGRAPTVLCAMASPRSYSGSVSQPRASTRSRRIACARATGPPNPSAPRRRK